MSPISQSKTNRLGCSPSWIIINIYKSFLASNIFNTTTSSCQSRWLGGCATAVGGNFDGGRCPDDWKVETYWSGLGLISCINGQSSLIVELLFSTVGLYPNLFCLQICLLLLLLLFFWKLQWIKFLALCILQAWNTLLLLKQHCTSEKNNHCIVETMVM